MVGNISSQETQLGNLNKEQLLKLNISDVILLKSIQDRESKRLRECV